MIDFLFLPVIYQVIKKKYITGISFALGGGWHNFSHQIHAVGLSFVEKKILTLVTWFSQYSDLKVQNFAIICQL
jgi:hypothetical protein